MSTTNETQPSASPPPRPAREKRNDDRRGDDRRDTGERRVEDRRVGDRRAGEPYGKWTPKRRIRKETKVLLGLLAAAVVLLVLNLAYFNPPLRTIHNVVEVEIAQVGVWRCSPVALSDYFANQDALKKIATGKVLSEKILSEQTKLRSERLVKSAGTENDYLLDQVRAMPWQEFAKRAEFTPKSKGVPEPSIQECEVAIKSARIVR